MSEYPMKWDLDDIFPGGSRSERALAVLDGCARAMDALDTGDDAAGLAAAIRSLQAVAADLRQVASFGFCLEAADTSDPDAVLLSGRVMELDARCDNLWLRVEVGMANLSDDEFEGLLTMEGMSGIAFNLRERRRLLVERMDPSIEMVVGDLITDGFHSWGKLYDIVSGGLRVRVDSGEGVRDLSLGQANNILSKPDRELRRKTFDAIEEAWSARADEVAAVLNSSAGFRTTLYGHRKWGDLTAALNQNRIKEETLRAMWSAVDSVRPAMVGILDRKAALLGLEKASWFDLHAPVGGSEGEVGFDEACAIIIDNFGDISPDMAGFAKTALSKGWVEAEDRPGKAQGAFCTSLPVSGESRVFMTYGRTASSVSTLAHELGHGYHSYVLRELPYMARRYPMDLAETASVFAETLVSRALLAKAGPEQRLGLLGDRVNDAIAMLMDIRGRFIFEEALLKARRSGPLGARDLNALMEEAQRTAFGNALDRYFPMFWAAKLHYYDTHTPFYNFPYTFGYLFSIGLVKMAEGEGRAFAPRYRDLLRDSGRMTVEDLAQRHLGADITREGFWLDAVAAVIDELKEFTEQ